MVDVNVVVFFLGIIERDDVVVGEVELCVVDGLIVVCVEVDFFGIDVDVIVVVFFLEII